ncbi:MAG: SDR family oxidoreductase [Candidatus Nanoarchaeia archaeon]|nr:SDR family oxidoreductase [Candidatus Nanoarchaeia archaeon]|tara:strand:+ start:2026 stop:3111 length:1086 start_codon:yes stop_codon:yes gene_type:complete
MVKVFITGATGFIGSSLLKALIERTDVNKFNLLVRNKEKSIENLSDIIGLIKDSGKEIRFLEGDVTKENLGLTSEEIEAIQDIEEVYHLASNISLSNEEKDKKLIFKCNIDGTRNILEIFKDSNNLKEFYFFSSAYSCGKTQENVKEDWLTKPDSFRNYYEESKWLSEELIKEYVEKHNMNIIILRPSIVSISLSTEFSKVKNQTFYYYSRILRKAVRIQEIPKIIRLIGKSNSTSNIIPLNDLINIIIDISKLDQKSRFYNLVNPINLSTKSFIDGIEESLNFDEGFIFKEELDYESLSDEEKFIYDRTKAYFEYNLVDNLEWNCSKTEEIREKLNIKEIDNSWIKEHIKKFFSFLENEG